MSNKNYVVNLQIFRSEDDDLGETENDEWEDRIVDLSIPQDKKFKTAEFIRLAAYRVRDLAIEMGLDDDPTVSR